MTFFSIRNWLLKVFLLDPNGGVFVNYINDLSKMINENGMQGINKQCSRTCSAGEEAVQQPGIPAQGKAVDCFTKQSTESTTQSTVPSQKQSTEGGRTKNSVEAVD